MEFKKYQHIERFGRPKTYGINEGKCYVFPKIDGTNASVYLDENGEVKAGSRNRELSEDADNAGFYKYINENMDIINYLKKHPTHRLYGEWLVPHTLKSYKENAWRKFYIFDVCTDNVDGSLTYLDYEIYSPLLEQFNLDYIAPIAIFLNPSHEELTGCLCKNNFLIDDGNGVGEGIVIKNYDFYNKYGQQVWAKIINTEFKVKMKQKTGQNIEANENVEQKIVDEYVTEAFVAKEYAKILNDVEEWEDRLIPRLLNIVFYELINEETWNAIKKYKNPKVDFKLLQKITFDRVKALMPEVFA